MPSSILLPPPVHRQQLPLFAANDGQPHPTLTTSWPTNLESQAHVRVQHHLIEIRSIGTNPLRLARARPLRHPTCPDHGLVILVVECFRMRPTDPETIEPRVLRQRASDRMHTHQGSRRGPIEPKICD